MKKLWILLAWAAIAAACSNEAELPSPQPSEDEMVEVSFNLAGDYVSVEETPMTRATGRTIYAVQIHKATYFPVQHGYVSVSWDKYASGVLTIPENMRVMLLKGETYRFNVSVVKEREDNVNVDITNEILIQQKPVESLYQGDFQRVEIYEGELEMKVTDNSAITVELSRKTFAITYNIEPPIEGTVNVYSDDVKLLSVGEYSDELIGTQYIYSQQNNIHDRNFRFVWTRNNEILCEVEKQIKTEIGKNLILNVDVNKISEKNGFTVTFKDEGKSYEDETHDIN